MPTDLRPALDSAALLERTLPTLGLDQVASMGELALAGPDRTAPRVAAIDEVADDRVRARWDRWSTIFGLPRPPAGRPLAETLLHPYAAVGRPHRTLAGYLTGVLAVFDAGLAAACADPDLGSLLAGPWRETCLPTSITNNTVFGLRTGEIRRALAAPAPRIRLDDTWTRACRIAEDTATTWGVPFLLRHLRAEVDATRPDAPDAVWGAVAATALSDRLRPQVRAVLTGT